MVAVLKSQNIPKSEHEQQRRPEDGREKRDIRISKEK